MAENDISMNIRSTFKAFYVEKTGNGFQGSVMDLPFEALPDHEVTIQVAYSSLNYKDALSATGLNKVTRSYPHVPGIDASGTVVEDFSDTFQKGTEVIVTGYDLGTNTFGGFGELIRVPKGWVVKKPNGLSLQQAMIFGTAGFTAIYGIKRLQQELITPDSGKILVTGATGGVGSLAVFALSQMGYEVVAITRKSASVSFLRQLGASEIIPPEELISKSNSPLLSRKWAGAIETVGGPILDAVLKQTYSKGAVACCGNILGKELHTNVYPFILRGVSLLGIDSAFCVQSLRHQIWETISSFNVDRVPNNFSKTITLDTLEHEIELILAGKQMGRVVLSHK